MSKNNYFCSSDNFIISKMQHNKPFNLFDFGLKKAGKIKIYDEHIVSHFLHTQGTNFEENLIL